MGYFLFLYPVQVTYNVDGFIDKNNDLLFKDMSQAMYSCDLFFLKEMFPEGKLHFFKEVNKIDCHNWSISMT